MLLHQMAVGRRFRPTYYGGETTVAGLIVAVREFVLPAARELPLTARDGRRRDQRRQDAGCSSPIQAHVPRIHRVTSHGEAFYPDGNACGGTMLRIHFTPGDFAL